MTNEAIEVRFETDDEAEIELLAESVGLEVRKPDAEPEDFGIISIVLLIGALLAVVKVVMTILDQRRGGVEIHVADKKIKRNKELPAGWVVIYSADGKSVEVETKDEPKDAIERMVEAILKLPVDATVETVKKVIEEAMKGEPGEGGDEPQPEPQPAT